MTKNSEFPINGNAKTLWTEPKTTFHYEISSSNPCTKSLGIPKMRLDFQNINGESEVCIYKLQF